MERFFKLSVFCFCMISVLSFLSLGVAQASASTQVFAAETTIMSVSPQRTTVANVGDVFSVDIVAENVTDLYGFQFDLIYSPSILSITSVTEGDLISSVAYFDPGAIDNVQGKVQMVNDTLLGNLFGFSGNIKLARVTFATKASGIANITLSEDLLSNSSGTPISHGIANGVARVAVVNTPPVADAGPDQTVKENVTATLDGTGSSDVDGDALSYHWTKLSGPDVTLTGSTNAKPTITTPNVESDTVFVFQLAIDDGNGGHSTDTVSVTIINNLPPTANAGQDQTKNEGETVTLDGSGSSDPNNDTLTYAWTQPQGQGIALTGANTASPTFTAPEVTANTELNFTLTISDGIETDSDSVIITVNNVNKLPTADAGPDQTVNENALVTLFGSGTDPDQDQLTYSWTQPNGQNISLDGANTASPTFTAPEVGADIPLTFTLTVNDGKGGTDSDSMIVNVKNINKTPTANAGDDKIADENTLVTLSGSGTDPDQDALSYSWTQPSGQNIALTGANTASPTFTAPEVQNDTDYTFTLTVNDGNGGTATDSVKVTVKQVNKAPIANAGSDQVVDENTAVTLNGSGSSDPDGDPITYLWTQPQGQNITLTGANTASPTFTTPEVTANTDLTFTLKVSDNHDASANATVKVTVRDANKAPTANAGDDQGANENTLVTLYGSGIDLDEDPIAYQWTASQGITLSDTTVANPTFIAPEVQANTDYTFTLTVSDGRGGTGTDTVKITVIQVNKAPTANAGPDQTVSDETVVTLDGSTSSDPDSDTLAYQWLQTSGPNVILTGSTNAKPTFTAPVVREKTTLTFQLTVNDGHASTNSDTVNIEVVRVPVVSIIPAASTQNVNDTFTLDIVVTKAIDLYGFQFMLNFDPTKLEAIGTSSIDFPVDHSFFVPGEIDNTAGTISDIGATLTGVEGGLEGNLALARIQFKAKATGDALVTIAKSKLSDSEAQPVAHELNEVTHVTIKDLPTPKPAAAGGGGGSDTDPPFMAFVSPGDGWSLTNTIETIVVANDPSGINRVDFYIDGQFVGTDNSEPYIYEWNTLNTTNGGHVISAATYDNNRNFATAALSVNVANGTTAIAALPITPAIIAQAPVYRFQIHGGAYHTKRMALKRIAKLKKRGFTATIIFQGGARPYLVEVAKFEALDKARAMYKALIKKRLRFVRLRQI